MSFGVPVIHPITFIASWWPKTVGNLLERLARMSSFDRASSLIENMAIEKYDGAQGLILSKSRTNSRNCKMGDEGFNFQFAHF